MDSLLSMTFEAHYPDRNHHRFYELRISRDLFGAWMLTTRYGRIGQHGQEHKLSSHDKNSIREQVTSILKRRATAAQRIGCSYRYMTSTESDSILWDSFLEKNVPASELQMPESLFGSS